VANNIDKAIDTSLLRVFVAIEMPEKVKREIEKIQNALRRLDLFDGKYVKPEHAHLTLQFIGYVEPQALGIIKNLLKTVTFRPIQAKLGRIGAFGNQMFIKVVWLGVEGIGLTTLARDIEQALAVEDEDNKPVRKRPFQSHVTLARVKKAGDVNLLRGALESLSVEPISFAIDEFVLKQSHLSSDGPIYVDLERYVAR